jgi:alpha-tubulin suppressor-like RCC1 family protein
MVYLQLGLGHYSDTEQPTRIATPNSEKIVDVAAGDRHTLLVTEHGRVLSCGADNFAQLGFATGPW